MAVHRGERTAKKEFSGVNIGSRVPSILNHIKTGDLGHSKFILNSWDYYSMVCVICSPFCSAYTTRCQTDGGAKTKEAICKNLWKGYICYSLYALVTCVSLPINWVSFYCIKHS